MPRKKGTNKTGGRKKGTPNRKTVELKEFLDSINLCIPERVIELLPKLDEKDQVGVLLKLMEYVYPKRRSQLSITTNSEQKSFVEIVAELDI